MNLRAEEQMSQEGRVEDQKEGTEDPALSFLLQGERLDSLDRKGYRIIQDPQRFCFGMDAVLLSAFARKRPQDRALDLGTGTGVIPLLMHARYGGHDFTALEIQEASADMARRSVALNRLEEDI